MSVREKGLLDFYLSCLNQYFLNTESLTGVTEQHYLNEKISLPTTFFEELYTAEK